MNRQIKKNTFYNLIKSVTQIIFPLITFPYISRTLTAVNIGKYNFANSIVSYFTLIASLGISTYAIRECSKIKDNKEVLQKEISQIISLNLFTTLFSYFLLFILLIFSKKLESYRTLIIILSSSMLFGALGADWINNVMGDFKYITVRSFVFQVVSLVLMFMFVHKQEDYINYAIICVVSSSGSNILNYFYRRRYCKTTITLNINVRKRIKPIMLLFAMVLSQTIFLNSDTTILGMMRNNYEVGLYSTSVKIYTIVNTMMSSVYLVVMPQMSYYFNEKKYKEINSLFNYSAGFIFLLGIPAIVGINALCSDLIVLIAGKEYLGATLSLHILTLALFFSLLGGLIGNTILLPSMKENFFLKACIFSAIVNIILNLVLIPSYGLNAAAFTTLISQLIVFLLNLKHKNKEVVLINKKDLLLGPIVGSVLIFICCNIMKIFITNLYIRIIWSILISILVYIATLIFTKNENTLKILNKILKRN